VDRHDRAEPGDRLPAQTREQVELPDELPGGDPIDADTFAVLGAVRQLPDAYRETLLTGKVTMTVNPNQFLSIRYGRNQNSQPYGVSPQSPPNNWAMSENTFNSINMNHNWVLGAILFT